MRSVDIQYRDNILRVLNNKDDEKEVRAKWKDGKNAKTVGVSQIYNEIDVYNKFPITNFRKINYKKAINEILWIFQKCSNRLLDLDSKIWDNWEYKNTGTIGHTYGFIAGKQYMSMKNKYPNIFGDKEYLNQVEYLFQTIIDNPNDRRMMINLYDLNEIQKSNLPPCAFLTEYTVSKRGLNMHLTQRSGDMLVASNFGGWNTVQYAFLHNLIAKCCGLNVNKFSHFVMDSHIYDKHLSDNNIDEYINQTLNNDNVILSINVLYDVRNIENKEEKLKLAWHNFLNFTEEDYELINYNPSDYKLKLEVAV